MNVLVLTHSAAIGGASRSLTTVVQALRSAECHLSILTPPGPMCATWEQLGAEVVTWVPPTCVWFGAATYASGLIRPSPGYLLALLLLPLRLLKAAQAISRLLAKEAINVVYVNSLTLFPIGVFLRFSNRNRSVKVVWHVREMINPHLPSPIYSLIIHSIAYSADQILAITPNEAQAFEGYPVTVVHNAVDPSWLLPTNRVSLDQAPLRVCMATAFLQGKGIPDYLQMARVVVDRFPEVEFVLYTSRPALNGRTDALSWHIARRLSGVARLISASLWHVQECSFDGRIRCYFDRQMTPEEYGQYCIYVRADETGCPWGRDIIEAMCVGLPVVATGSSQVFILEGRTGFLVPPGRPELLADCVERLLRDPELRKSMALESRARALQLFSPETFRKKLLPAFGLTNVAVLPEESFS